MEPPALPDDREVQRIEGSEDGWPSAHAPVLLEYRSYTRGEHSRYTNVFFGLHIDGDGTVWSFRYPSAVAPRCDYREITGDAAREACIYQDSTLMARLSSDLLARLKKALVELDDAPIKLTGEDVEGALLTVGPAGTRNRRPITVGTCGTPQPFQLQSPEARVIIDVFRRARRAARLPAPCSAGEHREVTPEIVPGVPAWTAR